MWLISVRSDFEMDSTRSVSARASLTKHNHHGVAGIAWSAKPAEIASCFPERHVLISQKKKRRKRGRESVTINVGEQRLHVTSEVEAKRQTVKGCDKRVSESGPSRTPVFWNI